MSLEILIRLLVDNIALAILILLLLVGLPSLVNLLDLQLLPQGHGVLYLGDVGEVGCVGDAETPHAVGVSPLGEMTLESLRALAIKILFDQSRNKAVHISFG